MTAPASAARWPAPKSPAVPEASGYVTIPNAVVPPDGGALDGILDDAHYRSKFGVSNPNLPVLRRFQKAGVELFVCGQNLAFEDRDPRAIAREVKIASDALIVLMKYQNGGYALLSF
jgi:intracellular sulfur oxidation DsrE/DsrF family protein